MKLKSNKFLVGFDLAKLCLKVVLLIFKQNPICLAAQILSKNTEGGKNGSKEIFLMLQPSGHELTSNKMAWPSPFLGGIIHLQRGVRWKRFSTRKGFKPHLLGLCCPAVSSTSTVLLLVSCVVGVSQHHASFKDSS